MRYEYELLRSMTLTTSRIAIAYSRGGRGSRIGVGSVQASTVAALFTITHTLYEVPVC